METVMKKITAVLAVVILLTVSVVVLQQTNTNASSDKELNLIARVNEEGSMIFLDPKYDPNEFCTVDSEGNITYYPDAWGGKIFGTPGRTSIQHKMLESIVKDELGLKFMPYTQGMDISPDTVYYDTVLTNLNVWVKSTYLDGGTIWEPVCTAIINDTERGATFLINSKDIEPNHTCCVIAASHSYLNGHENAVVRFLAAYVEAVDALNAALSKGTGDPDYEALVELAMNNTKQSRTVVESALKDVKYTYGNDKVGVDSDATPLVSLRESIATFAKNAGFSTPIESLGYSGDNAYGQFSDTFVNDTYLSEALAFEYDSTAKYEYTRITVAAISGDIHQIALHYGMSNGIFTKYGIGVAVITSPNGAGVVTSLQNGAASIGFMGAPPITSTSINSKLDIARYYEVTGTVTDSSGKTVSGANVTITNAYGETYTATTNSDGKFSVKVLGGTYNNVKEGAGCGISVTSGSLAYSNGLSRVGSATYLGGIVLGASS